MTYDAMYCLVHDAPHFAAGWSGIENRDADELDGTGVTSAIRR
jgi:hypothetical protein